MMAAVKCARCSQPVDVWGYGKSLLFWFLLSGVTLFVGALTTVVGIGFVILPIGAVMLFGAPVWALATKGMRRCAGCKQMWPPKKDGERAA